MTDRSFDSPKPIPISEPKIEHKRSINPLTAVDTLVKREISTGLLDQMDLQMVVGSAGAVVDGLLPAEARPIKDLDTVTVVRDRQQLSGIYEFFDQHREELSLCQETSDVFIASPLPENLAGDAGPYPIINVIHMLTWSRPHVVRMSDHFRNTVLSNACKGFLSETHVAELQADYLVAAASISGLLEKDLSSLTLEQIREVVDTATSYKMDYYLGKHTDYSVKTSVSLPGNLVARGLYEKLSSFGIQI